MKSILETETAVNKELQVGRLKSRPAKMLVILKLIEKNHCAGDYEAQVRAGLVPAVSTAIPISRIVEIRQHKYTKNATCVVYLSRPEEWRYAQGTLAEIISLINGDAA
jgi:hypothetical protein